MADDRPCEWCGADELPTAYHWATNLWLCVTCTADPVATNGTSRQAGWRPDHKQMLDGIRLSIREITDELIDWAENAMDHHGPDAVNPDPIALAVHLRILTDLARDAAQARDHLASLMAPVVRANPHTFREPLPGIGLLKVGADTTRHDYDDAALASRLARAVTHDDQGAPLPVETAVAIALRCAGAGWRVTGLRALGIDVDAYRTTTHGTPKTRIE